jgi:hypothetical protein
MRPTLFDMPPEENPEPGLPSMIEHGCDYMLLPDGGLEFYYNYLLYHWNVNDEQVQARAYLDDGQKLVSVFVKGERLHSEPFQPLIRYLQRRYTFINSFHAEDVDLEGTGYAAQFRRRGVDD